MLLDAAGFAQRMAALLPSSAPRSIAVAVSGGADSMALTLMAAEWATTRGIPLHAITIDHRLRPESRQEAEQVQRRLVARGITHRILTWQHDALPIANLQARAREARYALLAEYCVAQQIQYLLLAHHQDDQAETVLLRLQRGSGVDGLSAMRPVSHHYGITLLRPLLDVPKAALQAWLEHHGQPWLEDPSNQNRAFARVRVREALASAGVDTSTLAATASRLARTRDFLEQETARAMAACVTPHPAGFLEMDFVYFQALHEEIALRVLARCLQMMQGGAVRARFHELLALYRALPAVRTLAGCHVVPRHGVLQFRREIAALAPPVTLTHGQQGMWDGRFGYHCQAGCPPWQLGALGVKGLAQVKRAQPQWRPALPAAILHALPALWHLDIVQSVPHIGYRRHTADDSVVTLDTFPHGREGSAMGWGNQS